MTACGKKNSDLLIQNSGVSIFNCFKKFSIGTDLSKSCQRIQAGTTLREYCLLRNFKLKNPPTVVAKILTSGLKNKDNNKCISSDSTVDTTTATHNGINNNNDDNNGINDDDDIDNDVTNTINNEPQQPLYEIDINKGIGTIEYKDYKPSNIPLKG